MSLQKAGRMTDKPIALLISPVLPQPGGSGRALRAWGWLLELQRDYRVHVLLPISPAECLPLPADYPAEAIRAIGAAVASGGRWQRLLTLLLPFTALVSRRGVVDWLTGNSVVLQRLTAELDAQPVARIVVFRLYLHDVAQSLAARFPHARLELDLDDYESRTRLSVAGCLLRLGLYREALRSCVSALQYAMLEWFLPGRYQTAYLAAAEDSQRFSTRLARDVECRPNRVAGPPAPTPMKQGEDVCLLFVGTLNYSPNEEAVRFLLRDLVPALKISGLRWRLNIVGRHAGPALTSLLQTTAQVEHLADVDDLAACYASAQIVLVPLRAGGGSKLKTLEGFAHGRPLVSTEQGVRGLSAEAGVHYLPARTAQQFAAAIVQLASDPQLAGQLAAAGRDLWQKDFQQ